MQSHHAILYVSTQTIYGPQSRHKELVFSMQCLENCWPIVNHYKRLDRFIVTIPSTPIVGYLQPPLLDMKMVVSIVFMLPIKERKEMGVGQQP